MDSRRSRNSAFAANGQDFSDKRSTLSLVQIPMDQPQDSQLPITFQMQQQNQPVVPAFDFSADPSRRKGVVAVIFRGKRLLVIRRSQTVTAPGMLCLPGGGIEVGESESQALVREMLEELNVKVEPVRLCWRSTTTWGTNLAWWLATIQDTHEPIANPDEVEEIYWMTKTEILNSSSMLPSLPQFIEAWHQGEVELDHQMLRVR